MKYMKDGTLLLDKSTDEEGECTVIEIPDGWAMTEKNRKVKLMWGREGELTDAYLSWDKAPKREAPFTSGQAAGIHSWNCEGCEHKEVCLAYYMITEFRDCPPEMDEKVIEIIGAVNGLNSGVNCPHRKKKNG